MRPRPYALITPGYREMRVETMSGESLFRGKRSIECALEKLRGHVCYVTSAIERMKHTTGARDWTMNTWHGRETAITHHGTNVSVSSLRGTLDQSDHPFRDLTFVFDWLEGYGVAPSGLSAMSWNLFRASLRQETVIGADPELGRSAFFGGRKGINHPGSYFNQRLVDKIAAYPTAMSRMPVALSLHEVSVSTYLDPTVAGLARATVVVPSDLPYPPMPTRVGPEAIQFQWGPVNGVWPWVELAHAVELGCDVVIRECWAPAREAELFGPWWLMAQGGRDLPGFAPRMAKALHNCLWGQFAMDEHGRAEVSWGDDAGRETYVKDIDSKPIPHKWLRHVAAEVTGRVRNDLSRALYETGGTGIRATHLDTDGIIVPDHAPLPSNMGEAFGDFKVKEEMAELQVKAPQFYRFKRDYEPGLANIDNPTGRGRTWHYVASGMNEMQAAEVFRRRTNFATKISFLSAPDMVLPDGLSFDFDANEQLAHDARMIRHA